MKNLPKYEIYQDINNMGDIRKSKKGYLVHIKDLIKYLKSFDSSDEIKDAMDYIIKTQLHK